MRLSFILIILLLTSCASRHAPELVSINLIDREGMSETVTNDERLKRYVGVDFLAPQPYLKVLRVYKDRDSSLIPAFVTSYHPNGQLKQYLEVVNGRASGTYQEWYPNGMQKLEANIIGGTADVTTEAEKSWLFDGISRVWNEEGAPLAEISYDKGVLSGPATHYHANGAIAKLLPYEQGQLHGLYSCYREDGTLILTAEYSNGRLNGSSLAYWEDETLCYEEFYRNQKLISGLYLDRVGNCVSKIEQGKGWRALPLMEGWEYQEFRAGVPEGEVKVMNSLGFMTRTFFVKNGAKHGQEILYYPLQEGEEKPRSKVSFNWVNGNIHGLVKTWYEEGGQESQREMSRNVKNGLLTAWYKDGNLMLMEEYDSGKLIKGKYYRKGEKQPVSKVIGGRGVVTIFDGDGTFLRKMSYNNGAPSD